MKIFADHCIHTDVVQALRDKGFNVERAIDAGLEKSPDEKIFNYAIKTSRILLTFDRDFGNIIRFNIKRSAGIVIISVEKMSWKMIIKQTVNFFQKNKEKNLAGTIYIIEPKRVRIWPK
ncbi:DUF5615 family PIN-like protein [Patescibacteria group bacterium AH-259-L07]|nr:DUF5615 family PIN-like protein [Patescibacteria group bacterium AH-259-L07]